VAYASSSSHCRIDFNYIGQRRLRPRPGGLCNLYRK
jgi:hypothetical protein